MRKKILIMTTAFPRWKDDTYPSFIYELAKTLSKKEISINVLSPHYPNAKPAQQNPFNPIHTTDYGRYEAVYRIHKAYGIRCGDQGSHYYSG